MKINLKLLKRWDACSAGYSWFKRKYGNKSIEDVDVLDGLAYCRGNWNFDSISNVKWLVSEIYRYKKSRDYIFLFQSVYGPWAGITRLFYLGMHGDIQHLSRFLIDSDFRSYRNFKFKHPTVTELQVLRWFNELD